jgi:hypothetical protein
VFAVQAEAKALIMCFQAPQEADRKAPQVIDDVNETGVDRLADRPCREITFHSRQPQIKREFVPAPLGCNLLFD